MSALPITPLDIFLLVVMLVSGLLAMIRGFIREVLSIASWAAAALATLYLYSRLLPEAKKYFTNDYVAMAVVVGGVFLGTLIIVSIITIKISDSVLDSRVGALDRTFGFLFGLLRGLLIVVVCFLFVDWLVRPVSRQPEWMQKAKSRVVLQETGDWLMSILPDIEGLYAKYKQRQKRDEETADPPPGERSDLGVPDAGRDRNESIYAVRVRMSHAWQCRRPTTGSLREV